MPEGVVEEGDSGAAVPDVLFYWGMGAGETDVSRYRYTNGTFTGFDGIKCLGEHDRHGICANLSTPGSDVESISPAEYESLRQHADSSLAAQFADAHAVDIGLINDINARIVGVECGSRNSNCSISAYGCKVTYPNATAENAGRIDANLPSCQYWKMIPAVSGWGVANVSDFESDPFAPRVALVIARQLSANSVQLTRYSAITDTQGPQPGMTLSSEKCTVMTNPASTGQSRPDARP